jgi:hypothetical protein
MNSSLAKSFTYPQEAPTGTHFLDEDDYDYHFRFGDGANARNKLFALAYEISGKAYIYRSSHASGRIEPVRLKQFLYLQQFVQDHFIDHFGYWKSNLVVFHLILEYVMFFLQMDSTARNQITIFQHALNALLLLPSFDYNRKEIFLPSPFISKDSLKYIFDQCLRSCRETRPLEGIIRDLEMSQTPTVDNLKVSCSHLFLQRFSITNLELSIRPVPLFQKALLTVKVYSVNLNLANRWMKMILERSFRSYIS